MYLCTSPVCDPLCDFCWFCDHNEIGVPTVCRKSRLNDFHDGFGYCTEFRCALHQTEHTEANENSVEYVAKVSASSGRVLTSEEMEVLAGSILAGNLEQAIAKIRFPNIG